MVELSGALLPRSDQGRDVDLDLEARIEQRADGHGERRADWPITGATQASSDASVMMMRARTTSAKDDPACSSARLIVRKQICV